MKVTCSFQEALRRDHNSRARDHVVITVCGHVVITVCDHAFNFCNFWSQHFLWSHDHHGVITRKKFLPVITAWSRSVITPMITPWSRVYFYWGVRNQAFSTLYIYSIWTIYLGNEGNIQPIDVPSTFSIPYLLIVCTVCHSAVQDATAKATTATATAAANCTAGIWYSMNIMKITGFIQIFGWP